MKFKPFSVLSLIIFLALTVTGFAQLPVVKKQLPVEEKQTPVEMKNVSMNERKVQDPNHRELKWKAPQTIEGSAENSRKFLIFDGAGYPIQFKGLPTFSESIKFNKPGEEPIVELINQKYETISETNLITDKTLISADVKINANLIYFKKQPYINITFIPIRKNSVNGIMERLVSFDYKISSKPSVNQEKSKHITQTYTNSSVLASGSWYKIGITGDGVYKLSYSYLKTLGLDVDNLNPTNLRIYGNGGGMLPMGNWIPRADDLIENPIVLVGGTNGHLNFGDYVLFFGQGPNRWYYGSPDSSRPVFQHVVNNYSDTSYYFITADLGQGKRITTQASATGATKTVTSFDDYAYHEADLVNIMQSGRTWYGEAFDILSSYDFTFNFPNLDGSSKTYFYADVVANSCPSTSSFTFYCNSAPILNLTVAANCASFPAPAALDANGSDTFQNNSSAIDIKVSYANPGNATAWLDYFELNVRRQLRYTGGQMLFRDSRTVGAGNITEFDISNTNSNLQVWDVTDPTNEFQMATTFDNSSGIMKFSIHSDLLHEFMIFDPNGAYQSTPIASGRILNQNLHSLAQKDYIIVSYPDYLAAAKALGDFHQTHDGLSYVVVTPQQIYNEFSSGKQDITAIRSFVKMFYDRAGADSAKLPKYLLLFGDGSYDNKNRLTNNTNFIPTFESANSIYPTSSFVSDDYYGLLDDNEGYYDDGSDNGVPDIGIGRFPVDNVEEADAVVLKTMNYLSLPKASSTVSTCNAAGYTSVYGDWRNDICFVAGDKEQGTFVQQAEQLYNQLTTGPYSYPVYNINKIYFDAYVEQSTPGGQRYPDVNAAITAQVQQGCLIMNYTGHGGQAGWGFERVLDDNMINSWTNYNNLVCFFTATCEFSAFDNPGLVSAGELALLNPAGGAICLFSTERLVYSGPNQDLNLRFFRYVFKPINGLMPDVGTVMEYTKLSGGMNNTNDRNFTLLGDPACRLAYPYFNVATSKINGASITVADTLKALEKVTITGFVTDLLGNPMPTFNGVVYPTVYDKPTQVYTLANDPGQSPVIQFNLQNSIIYRGKSRVTNGTFTSTFIVPKDIAYQYGYGKLSYYGYDTLNLKKDANGYCDSVIVGGFDATAPKDTVGPTIKLYMNDTRFVFGGTTDANPVLYAVLVDASGINTIGNGIGHDITAQLDNDNSKIYVLDNYYQADLDKYQSGTVVYPFTNLAPGRHSITFRAWDVYNNSSSAYLEFVVEQSTTFSLEHVLNYPNPFTTHTSFFFEHNCACEALSVQVQIFTITGRLVKTINTDMQTNGYRSSGIDWNGLDDYNERIARGVYIYRLKARKPDGETASVMQKLVILR